MTTEQLSYWQGEFGRAYTDRNPVDWRTRVPFFQTMLADLPLTRILEVGCNRGHNLSALHHLFPDAEIAGIEPNRHALSVARDSGTPVSVLHAHLFDFPFRDGWFDLVFTAGVLIHIHPKNLPAALEQIYRASRRYILVVEYHAEEETPVRYRGHDELLWKRDFLACYRTQYPELRLIRSGEWPQWDHSHWWLLEKPA